MTRILTTKRWTNWESMTLLGLIRGLKLQGKSCPYSVERKQTPSHSPDLLAWNRSLWSHKLVRAFKWQFGQTSGGWEWTSMRAGSFWGFHLAVVGVSGEEGLANTFITSRNSQSGSHSEDLEKSSSWPWLGKRRVAFVTHTRAFSITETFCPE